MNEHGLNNFTRQAGWAATLGGALATTALITVLVIEAVATDGRMSATGATAAGWASFVAASLLTVGLLGMAVRYVRILPAIGRSALLLLGFATAITVGATSTLALVVPHLLERMPDLVDNPPSAIPPTFIISGLISGICAIVLAVSLRRAGVRGTGTNLLFLAAVLTMVPLPSRFFMLSFAVGLLLLSHDVRTPERRTELMSQGA
jgi:hypothetical protein